MPAARVVSSCCALVAVAAGAVVVAGMSRSDARPEQPRPAAEVAQTPRPAVKTFADRTPSTNPTPAGAAQTSSASSTSVTSSAASHTSAVRIAVPAATTPTVGTPAVTTHASRAAAHPATRPATHVARPASAPRGQALPLQYSAGSATHVITVTAHSTGSTTATLQPWTKVSRGHWVKAGPSATAHIGSQGMTTHPSESKSATPIGSFTLTQAFGARMDPGTSLPYFRTTPRDYWISTAGSMYNTHQRCPASKAGCYANGVNERLYYETPFYNYAVVIDYNTRNAPGGVHQGRGSAFFLHVTDGNATAGCVSIPQVRLIQIMKWLTPGSHPRILIGTD